MFRSRFTRIALALGLGLTSGCLCLRSHPLFQKRAGSADMECATVVPGTAQGPVLDEATPMLPPVMPETATTVPPLAPPPRLVPQPQAQPAPYVPRDR